MVYSVSATLEGGTSPSGHPFFMRLRGCVKAAAAFQIVDFAYRLLPQTHSPRPASSV